VGREVREEDGVANGELEFGESVKKKQIPRFARDDKERKNRVNMPRENLTAAGEFIFPAMGFR
jgi:hypothetical protein